MDIGERDAEAAHEQLAALVGGARRGRRGQRTVAEYAPRAACARLPPSRPARRRSRSPRDLQQRTGHERRDQRHDHQHGEDARREDAEVEPMLSTTSSIRPRVFIRTPRAKDSRQRMPVERAASMLPPSLPAIATTMIASAEQPAASVAEQADLGAQAGEGEEERQQEHRAEGLEPLAQVRRGRRRRAASPRRRGRRRRGRGCRSSRWPARRRSTNTSDAREQAVAARVAARSRAEQRAASRLATTTSITAMNASAEQHGRHQRAGRGRSACATATTRASRHHAVTSSTAAQAMATAPSGVRGQAALLEDPRQHREGGDAHRDAHEQGEGAERRAGGRQRRGRASSAARAEEERHDDAGVAHPDRRARAAAQVLEVQLEADHEHEEDHADLAEQAQRPSESAGKRQRLAAGPEPAEQRRAEQDAGDHLADHRRLAERRNSAAEPRAAITMTTICSSRQRQRLARLGGQHGGGRIGGGRAARGGWVAGAEGAAGAAAAAWRAGTLAADGSSSQVVPRRRSPRMAATNSPIEAT